MLALHGIDKPDNPFSMSNKTPSPEPARLPPAAQRLLKKALTMATADEVPSPCVSVCRMSSTSQLCEGCWRSLDEIAGWSAYDMEDKRHVWSQLAERIRQFPTH